MKSLRAAVPLSMLLLLACRERPTTEESAAKSSGDETAQALPDADLDASLGPLGADPDRPGDPPRFVGRWAAEERLCDSAAWAFTADGLETPAGSVCRFAEVRAVGRGYDIAARCTAEGSERDDTIRLRPIESVGAMTFESESIADATLVRC